MLEQQLPVNKGVRLSQLSQVDPLILAAKLLAYSNTMHESIWEITHRVCDRYLGTATNLNPGCRRASTRFGWGGSSDGGVLKLLTPATPV